MQREMEENGSKWECKVIESEMERWRNVYLCDEWNLLGLEPAEAGENRWKWKIETRG